MLVKEQLDMEISREKFPFVVTLTEEERKIVQSILETFPPLDVFNVSNQLLTAVQVAAKKLPDRLTEALLTFRRFPNQYGTLVFRNLPVDPNLPATPNDGRPSKEKSTFFSEYGLLLFMLHLGEPISYADEKEGALIQNICPVKGMESKQENTGSAYLEFHTEDGFHPYKPDYLALTGLRADHDHVAKTASASVANVILRLPSKAIELLRNPYYRMKLSTSFTGDKEQIFTENIPVLSGSFLNPNLCIDFFLMEAINPKAEWALNLLKEELEKVVVDFVLEPGDLMIVDNRLAAHARSGFKPRYDGKDRWLQRMFVVEDFRRSSFSRGLDMHVCSPLNVELNI